MKNILSHLTPLILFFIITGCVSTPPKQELSKQHHASDDLQAAFKARGFYLTSLGNINFIYPPKCGNYQIQRNIGKGLFNKNSLQFIFDSIDIGYDVLKIPVRQTLDSQWVMIYDKLISQEINADNNNFKEKNNLQKDTRKSAQLNKINKEHIPLEKIIIFYKRHSKSGQAINIQIKKTSTSKSLTELDQLISKHIKTNQYFYSSDDLTILEHLRKINSKVFLSFIQRPAKKSIHLLKKELKNNPQNKLTFLQHKKFINNIDGAGKKYHVKRYDNAPGFNQLHRALKNHYGITIDIRHYLQNSTNIKTSNIPVTTYTINKHNYHAEALLKLKELDRPHSVIIDDTLYGFCSQYQLPPIKPYQAKSALTARMAELPSDLDLRRLSEINKYFIQGLYPSLSGQLKPIYTNRSVIHKPNILNTTADPKEAQTEIEIKSEKAIKIELRRKDDN